MILTFVTKLNIVTTLSFVFFVCALTPASVLAATLAVSPGTGVYKTGATFTVTVAVNTTGTPVNAADGTLSFNPRELAVVSATRGASIFNLWTTEPTFSNTAGTVTFSGGVPTGYTGAFGNVMTVTFRALTSGTSRISLTGASVLAADGKGTNVLTNMSGGTYTLSAVESQPAPEVIIEYVAPANTPAAPKIISDTHDASGAWSKEKTAVFTWSLPAGVTGVRTGLDKSPVAIPTKVYDSPIKTLTLSDLDEGVSYLHIQFKNADGWGKVAHYKLAVDSVKPESFEIKLPENADLSNPTQSLILDVKDTTSGVEKFKIQIDGKDSFEHAATGTQKTVTLPTVTAGDHSLVIEAIDGAGNSLISTFSFTITSFEKPVITDFPATLSTGVTPVIKGTTKPNATVAGTLVNPDGDELVINATADSAGNFALIPTETFSAGTYTLSVIATDVSGAISDTSDTITMFVSKPGYLKFGTFLISFFSVLIPLIALCVLTWLTLIYSLSTLRRFKAKVVVESEEASMMLATEFRHIEQVVHEQEDLLTKSHKTKKLTEAEEMLFIELRSALASAKQRVGKEVSDVTNIVKK